MTPFSSSSSFTFKRALAALCRTYAPSDPIHLTLAQCIFRAGLSLLGQTTGAPFGGRIRPWSSMKYDTSQQEFNYRSLSIISFSLNSASLSLTLPKTASDCESSILLPFYIDCFTDDKDSDSKQPQFLKDLNIIPNGHDVCYCCCTIFLV